MLTPPWGEQVCETILEGQPFVQDGYLWRPFPLKRHPDPMRWYRDADEFNRNADNQRREAAGRRPTVPPLDLRGLRSSDDDLDPERQGHEEDPYSNLQLSTVRFRWKQGRCIGRGHSSSVFECMNLDTGELMCVKQLSVTRSATGVQREAALAALYHREIELVRRLVHPHIVGYLGSEVMDDLRSGMVQMNIFMELCPCGSLRWVGAVSRFCFLTLPGS